MEILSIILIVEFICMIVHLYVSFNLPDERNDEERKNMEKIIKITKYIAFLNVCFAFGYMVGTI